MKVAEKAVASDHNKLLINKVFFFCYNDLETTATLNCYFLQRKVRILNYCKLAKR